MLNFLTFGAPGKLSIIVTGDFNALATVGIALETTSGVLQKNLKLKKDQVLMVYPTTY